MQPTTGMFPTEGLLEGELEMDGPASAESDRMKAAESGREREGARVHTPEGIAGATGQHRGHRPPASTGQHRGHRPAQGIRQGRRMQREDRASEGLLPRRSITTSLTFRRPNGSPLRRRPKWWEQKVTSSSPADWMMIRMMGRTRGRQKVTNVMGMG